MVTRAGSISTRFPVIQGPSSRATMTMVQGFDLPSFWCDIGGGEGPDFPFAAELDNLKFDAGAFAADHFRGAGNGTTGTEFQSKKPVFLECVAE